VGVSSADIESIWRDCWIKAPEGDGTFITALTAQWQAVRRLNAAGSLSSISKNSASQAASFGSGSTLTTVDLERAALEALRLFERLANLIDTTDEQVIYTEGLAQLANAPTEVATDISGLRYPCPA
jgi:hypothetical protein